MSLDFPKRSCETCKHAGQDPDGPYCASPPAMKQSGGMGLSLSSRALGDLCPHPAHPHWEPQADWLPSFPKTDQTTTPMPSTLPPINQQLRPRFLHPDPRFTLPDDFPATDATENPRMNLDFNLREGMLSLSPDDCRKIVEHSLKAEGGKSQADPLRGEVERLRKELESMSRHYAEAVDQLTVLRNEKHEQDRQRDATIAKLQAQIAELTKSRVEPAAPPLSSRELHELCNAFRDALAGKMPASDYVDPIQKLCQVAVNVYDDRERIRKELAKQKDIAYAERDQLVAALSKLFPSHLERHPDEDTTWEDAWRWIVMVQLPTGQASWHIHDSELPIFAHLVRDIVHHTWDGHTTEEKYKRLAEVPNLVRAKLVIRIPTPSRDIGMFHPVEVAAMIRNAGAVPEFEPGVRIPQPQPGSKWKDNSGVRDTMGKEYFVAAIVPATCATPSTHVLIAEADGPGLRRIALDSWNSLFTPVTL